MSANADFHRFNGVNRLMDQVWTGTILTRDPGSFTVLAVDRFRGPRLNRNVSSHSYWELVAVLGGTGELTGTTPQTLRRADVVLIPPGCDHGEYAHDSLDTVWVAITGSRFSKAGSGITCVRDEDITRLAEDLWIQASVRTDRSGTELDGLALALVGRFLRLSIHKHTGDLVDQAVRWLHEHLDQSVQVSDLARHLRISSAHLHRAFKLRTKRSPKSFLNALRIERATHLLRHTPMTSVSIATLVGFNDSLYFSRAFTKATGFSPSRFRENVAKI